MKKSFTN